MNMRFKRWSVTGAIAAALALLAVGVALFNLLDGGVTDALGPIAVLAEPKGADRATDARAADDKGQAFLPVPAPLDDDRVVDAIGPLIKLSCNRDDPESDAGGARSGVAVNALDAPLASYSPEAQAAATGPLLRWRRSQHPRPRMRRAACAWRRRTCPRIVPRCCATSSIACRQATHNRFASSAGRCC
jgi:hypothetical protein